VEYAESAGGPWTFVESQAVEVEPAKGEGPANFLVGHLQPGRTYYVRMGAEDASGEAKPVIVEFETTAPGPPEFSQLLTPTTKQITTPKLGTTFADFQAEIEADGTETEYHFEFASKEGGPYVPVPGGSGSITVGQERTRAEAKLENLTPEASYFIRVTATNKNGTVLLTKLCNSEIETAGCSASEIKGEFQTVSTLPRTSIDKVEDITEVSAHVMASVDPETYETAWSIEYTTEPNGTWSTAGSGSILGVEATEEYHSIEANLTGLKPGTVYYLRVSAENISGKVTHVGVESFTTVAPSTPPTVETDPDHVIHGEVIHVLGSIDPNGLPTHSYFEYVTQEQFEKEGEGAFTTSASVPTPSSEGAVGVDLPALQPGTTYDFRLVASNGAGTSYGAVETLTVPVAPVASSGAEGAACPNAEFRTGLSAHLPDCRAYEQVTPVDKEGALEITNYDNPTGELGTVVGEDGNHVMVVASQTHWGTGQSPYVFSRTSTGWQMTSVTTQPEAGVSDYRQAILSPNLSGIAVEASWALASGSESPNIEFKTGPPGGPYSTVASIPRSEIVDSESRGGWMAASEDFSKLILGVADHTLLGHATGTTSGLDLYEYSEGELRQVNVQSDGEKISTCGAKMARGVDEVVRSNSGYSTPHTVSADGAYVFFTDNCTHDLYMRVDGSETVDIGAYAFLAADARGSRLLLENGAHELFLYETGNALLKHLASHEEQVSVEESLGIIGRYSYFEASEYKGFVPAGGSKQLWRVDNAEKAVECISCASPFDPEPKQPVDVLDEGTDGLIRATRNGTPTERFESSDGEYAFFETSSALVPEDQNGELPANPDQQAPSNDVYEWRAADVDGCARIQGCVSLISPGTAGFLVGLIGTTASGHDVFFSTHSQLVPGDKDTAADVYDARIDGGFPNAAPSVECEGDACSTPASLPNDTTPSSLTSAGNGNLASQSTGSVNKKATKKTIRCVKGKVVSHGRCVKKKSKRNKSRKQSRAKSRKGGK
jgi:hypothetical protein